MPRPASFKVRRREKALRARRPRERGGVTGSSFKGHLLLNSHSYRGGGNETLTFLPSLHPNRHPNRRSVPTVVVETRPWPFFRACFRTGAPTDAPCDPACCLVSHDGNLQASSSFPCSHGSHCRALTASKCSISCDDTLSCGGLAHAGSSFELINCCQLLSYACDLWLTCEEEE